MQNIKKDQVVKPIVAAVTLMFTGAAWAVEEGGALPELQVETKKSTGYKAEKSASQKFTAPLIDTPKTVTVITEALIKDTGSNTFKEALRTTPGITFGGGEGGVAVGDRPFIRGFDAFQSMYVDGLRDLGAQQREVFAIEQMEVIKGPSGAYDGRGSAGGSINIVTKQAKAGNFTTGSVGVGSDRYRRATFDGNYMLGDDAAIRLVGMHHGADTPGRDNVDVKRWGFMPSITLGLNGPTSLTASWYHHETDDVPDWGLPYRQLANNDGGTPFGRPVGKKDAWYGVNGRDFHETSADIGNLAFKHSFSDDVVLRNTTRYSLTSNKYVLSRPNVYISGGTITPEGMVNRSQFVSRGMQTTALANLTDISVVFDTGYIKHNLNAGIEISREESENRSYADGNLGANGTTDMNNPNPDVSYATVTRNNFPGFEGRTVNKSAYVFDSMELTEKWLLNAGVRYDRYRSEIQNRDVGTGVKTTDFENDEGFFNYQLGIVYKVQPNASVYASYATSSSPVGLAMGDYNYGGTQLIAGTQDLSPERSKSFEVGTKWNVLEDLSLSAAIFHIRKNNARAVVPGGNYSNLGEVESKGIELGIAGKVTDKWQVFGGYTYLDAEQTKAGTVPDVNTPGSLESQGKQLHGIAKNSASLWTTYKVLPNLTLGGGAFYMDKVYANPANTAYVPSYVRWDAMASYKINENFDLQLNIQNLTDKRYFDTTYFRHYAVVAPGRVGFVTLNFKF
ncbi:TonB-dependent receptor [Methylobacillus methanolivorans]|uniref:TonB-dependent receptor n=1 Tax=Methylobacillus methanolivorans TaxID=1848927 RepID=A0ABW8GPE4_9PROT